MILEPIRLLTDGLNDSGQFVGNTPGVNALLASTPRDAGDSAPSSVTVLDETRSSEVARGDLPLTLPALLVTSKEVSALDGEVMTYTRDGVIEVVIRYAAQKTDTKVALQDASYTLRAALRSLRLFNAATHSRNSIDVYSCLSLRLVAMWTPVESAVVTGAIIGRWQLRDNAP